MLRSMLLLLVLFCVAGCGQRGALYLPPVQPPVADQPAPAAATPLQSTP